VSKVLWAGLRVGWVRAPESWITRMLSTKTVADLGSPLLSQLLVSRLMDDLDAVVAQRRRETRRRRDRLFELLERQLPSWQWTHPRGGLCAWVTLPQGNAVDFAEVARAHGVAITPGPALSVDDGNRRAIRIVFARPEATLAEGVRRLAGAWEQYVGTDAQPSPRLLV
jgi:DNA-binding transcriptional MocR family regulator